jgi:hypothetical protein
MGYLGRHCQLNGCLCNTEWSRGTLSAFQGHFMTRSGTSELHKLTTDPQSARGVIAHRLR